MIYYIYIAILNQIDNQIDNQIVFWYFANILIGSIISYFMYYNNIWAAGDAKLYFTILLLIPYSFFADVSINIFPGFILLVVIFSFSFIYLISETIFLLIKDIKIKKFNFKPKSINKSFLGEVIGRYLFSYFLCSIIIELLLHYSPEYYFNNRGFFVLINVLLISLTLKYLKHKNMIYAIIGLILIYTYIKIFIDPVFSSELYINSTSLITLAIVIFLRYLGSKYNYKEIPTNDVKAGMVLSFDTVLKFKKSRIKGLPEFTTEYTDSRITQDNAESIKLWGKARNENNVIRVVKHIPFAPFISFGTVVFLIMRIYHNIVR